MECFQNVEQDDTSMKVSTTQLETTAPKETRFKLPEITEKSKGKYFAVYYTGPHKTYYCGRHENYFHRGKKNCIISREELSKEKDQSK